MPFHSDMVARELCLIGICWFFVGQRAEVHIGWGVCQNYCKTNNGDAESTIQVQPDQKTNAQHHTCKIGGAENLEFKFEAVYEKPWKSHLGYTTTNTQVHKHIQIRTQTYTHAHAPTHTYTHVNKHTNTNAHLWNENVPSNDCGNEYAMAGSSMSWKTWYGCIIKGQVRGTSGGWQSLKRNWRQECKQTRIPTKTEEGRRRRQKREPK